jgi:F0F1-type ATP synthase membrane subunit b/b'
MEPSSPTLAQLDAAYRDVCTKIADALERKEQATADLKAFREQRSALIAQAKTVAQPTGSTISSPVSTSTSDKMGA